MNAPKPATLLDERFFDRRRRSSSVAGIAGGAFAGVLFLYRHYVDQVWNWDLFAVLILIVAIKMGLMTWYYFTDQR
jgi:hypothetical protein